MARLIFKAPYYKPRRKAGKGERGAYAKYIATRDGVELLRSGMADYINERKGSNGLFSDEGVVINLSQIEETINSHSGNVWGLIFSLKREDAERLGYNSAVQWMNLLRSHRNDIAKEMHIAPGNLCWYAAYHNSETHPHVHMLVWSDKPQEPHLSTVGIHNIKHTIANDIFGQDLISVYQNYCKPALRLYTQTTYEQRIYNQIVPKIGNVPLNQITAGTLEKFYAHLKSDGRLVRREIYGEGLANSVIRSIHAHCRASLEKARVEGLIRQNPAVHCKLPPKKSAEVEVLTVEEMQRLLIQAKEEGFYEMFLLDLSTGLRRGELLALMWDDINLGTGELKVNKQVRYFNKELHIMPPKTKAAYRTIILPLPLIEVLKEYRKKVRSKWLFPSPYKREQDLPRDPCACRKKLSQILEHAGCKQVPFHAIRHTFATQALRYGMDVKTLACTIGHESVETTLNVYSHATDEGMRTAAKTIDKTIGSLAGKYAEFEGGESEDERVPTEAPKPTPRTKFEPYKGKYRRQGTGSIHQVSKNVWEGRYSPIVNGKRITRNIYAGSIEECEEKLAQMIAEMKEEYGIA